MMTYPFKTKELLAIAFLTVFYKMEWRDESDDQSSRKGYFLVKRFWFWMLIGLCGGFLIAGLWGMYQYYLLSKSFNYHWIPAEEDKLSETTFKDRINLKERLIV